MNTQETIIQLKELKLKGMANTLESLMTLPVQSRPSFDFAIAKMVEAEILERKERKTEMFLKTSKLRYSAMIEDVACGAERNITTEQLAALADCSFIRRHENLLKVNAAVERPSWHAPLADKPAPWASEPSILI